jgi:hypothetical protein
VQASKKRLEVFFIIENFGINDLMLIVESNLNQAIPFLRVPLSS